LLTELSADGSAAGKLRDQCGGLPEGEAPRFQQVLERHSRHVLRHDHRQAVERGHFMDADNVRVAQLRRGPGFTLKAL
jgi:hypothetical protein